MEVGVVPEDPGSPLAARLMLTGVDERAAGVLLVAWARGEPVGWATLTLGPDGRAEIRDLVATDDLVRDRLFLELDRVAIAGGAFAVVRPPSGTAPEVVVPVPVTRSLAAGLGDAIADPGDPAAALFVRRAPGADPEALASAVLAEDTGRAVTSDPALAAAIIARGVALDRHALVLQRPLLRTDIVARDDRVHPLSHNLQELGRVAFAAYPADHPDHAPQEDSPERSAETIAEFLAGAVVGPLLGDACFEARGEDGRIVGYVILNEMPDDLLIGGGPWVTDIVVEPGFQGHGVGGAMLTAAFGALAASARPHLGLAVTATNPARRLYVALGFRLRLETWRFLLG